MSARATKRDLVVPLGESSYSVHLTDSWSGLAPTVRRLGLGPRALLVTDHHVGPLYAASVTSALERAGIDVGVASFRAGESRKQLTTASALYEAALDHGVDRGDAIIALGGGVAGDLAGFVAATLYRGVAFVQIPTTLLAMVDSAVGGKTGVNLARGKNLVGAFHQPRCVYANLATLRTLDPREVRAGLAEVIKSGMIRDAGLVVHLEDRLERVLALDAAALADAVARSVLVKARIVAADEREAGVRALLNYGHTIGHAIETVTRYRRFLHGEAIALGMLAAARLGVEIGVTATRTAERQRALIERAGLPLCARRVGVDEIVAALRYDKKVKAGKLRFILTSKVGSASVHQQPDEAHVRCAITEITSS